MQTEPTNDIANEQKDQVSLVTCFFFEGMRENIVDIFRAPVTRFLGCCRLSVMLGYFSGQKRMLSNSSMKSIHSSESANEFTDLIYMYGVEILDSTFNCGLTKI